MCGNCKPPEQFAVLCPECGSPHAFLREEYLFYANLPHRLGPGEEGLRKSLEGRRPECARCGAELTEPMMAAIVPEPCAKSRIVCGYPCGQKDVQLSGGSRPCTKMVPLARYEP